MPEYDRRAAVQYAVRWAYGRNPDFYDFSDLGGDCTNFASQVIFAGCGVMNFTPTYGWYYVSLNERAPAWTGVNELYRFLVSNRGPGPRATEVELSRAEPGDVIQLDFGGDGRFDHSPVVVRVLSPTPPGILVAAHSSDALFRPLSSYNYRSLRCLHITGCSPSGE